MPNEIFNLPNNCTIYFTGSNFSQTALENLINRVNQPDYIGPKFEFDMYQFSEEQRKPSEEIIKNLLSIVNQDMPEHLFSNILKMKRLNDWLNKLDYMKDYRSTNIKQ